MSPDSDESGESGRPALVGARSYRRVMVALNSSLFKSIFNQKHKRATRTVTSALAALRLHINCAATVLFSSRWLGFFFKSSLTASAEGEVDSAEEAEAGPEEIQFDGLAHVEH